MSAERKDRDGARADPGIATLAAGANGGMTRTYVGVIVVEVLVLIGLAALTYWFS